MISRNKKNENYGKILNNYNRDEIVYFNKLLPDTQDTIIKIEQKIDNITNEIVPSRFKFLLSNTTIENKRVIINKLNELNKLSSYSSEYSKLYKYVNTISKLPLGLYHNINIKKHEISDYLNNIKKELNEKIYGHDETKEQIIRILAQFIANPNARGYAIGIQGSMGVGKTKLIKDGIAKVLKYPFAFIPLGGISDSSYLKGHLYTYEGSTYGKIVNEIIKAQIMNPIFFFDELDKISDTPKGEEIIGILTHLTDTTQNSQFHDKYFAEIDFDLSKCLFMFSYNDETKINPILKDRMYRIQTTGYNQKQKLTITNKHLLPKIREQVKFESEDIVIPEQTINYIVENYCNKEDGVRNLKRCLEIIHTKINLYRLMRPDSNLFEEDMSIKVTFPFTVTKDIVDKLIKKTEGLNPSLYHMYI